MKYRVLVLAITPLFISSCDHTPQAEDYFPLKAGQQWEYRVERTELGVESKISTFSIETLPAESIGDQRYAVRRTSDGTDYYLSVDATGIFRHAKRTIVETNPLKDEPLRMVLPIPLQVGKSWAMPEQSYLIHRMSPLYEPPYRNVYRYSIAYTLTSLDETVTVPAGRFEHCVLVEGETQLNLFSGAAKGYEDIVMSRKEWYAPKVGLVRLEHSEPLDGDVFKGGNIVMELVR